LEADPSGSPCTPAALGPEQRQEFSIGTVGGDDDD
jgi:hypothetical protein